jgi:serine/threonine protein phosphatase PrpC
MEDTLCIADGFLNHTANGFFAIFDGHGGREISSLLQTKLHDNLTEELMIQNDSSTIEQKIER